MPDLVVVLRASVVALFLLCVGASAAVCWRYARAWARMPRRVGLTPLHVLLVSAVVCLDKGALAWGYLEQISRAAPVASPIRLWMYGASSLMLLAALWIIGGATQRRVRFCQSATVTVATTDTAQVHNGDTYPGEDRP